MEYLIKASAVIALFYLCFYLFLRKETFFNYNRWFFLTGIVIALIFPFVVIPIHIVVEPTVFSQTAFAISKNVPVVVSNITPEPQFEWQSILPMIYCTGLAIFLIQFLFQFGSLILLLFKNPKNKDGIYTYVIVNNKISPFSFFKWIVYNPNSFNEQELNLMLTHEKVHANQLHSIDILLIQLACSIFWFNPLIWLYRKEVRQNLEFIADHKTQEKSDNEKAYQRLLLKTSVANYNISISNNFYNSLIKERIIMLKKSRSNRKKQWRYLLMFPLLAGLLMSVNTEKVYIEGEANSINSEKTLEFVVTKNTTDSELKSMTGAVEEKGGTLVFSKIQRNNANELTNIFLKFNNHSYGNSGKPIESFIIYKELFGLGGGYTGRINGATLHYDDNTNFYDNKTSNALVQRAHKAILKAGIQTEEELKDFEKKRSEYKNSEIEKKKETKKSNKTISASKSNKTSKAIVMATPENFKKEPQLDGDTSITIIDKSTTDAELDKIKDDLKKEGLTVKFKGVKRNDKGEISAIKIEAKSQKSSTSYFINSDDEAIEPIKIVFDEDNNSISIGNGPSKHGKNAFVYETHNGGKHKIHTSGKGSNVFVISDDDHVHDDDHEARVIVRRKGKKRKSKRVRSNSNVQVISGDNDKVVHIIADDHNDSHKSAVVVNGKGKNVWVSDDGNEEDVIILQNEDDGKSIFISTDNGKDPLYIVDGKEVSKKKFKAVDPENIESVTVLKDKSAIERYGDKAKDGVIIIKTKKN